MELQLLRVLDGRLLSHLGRLLRLLLFHLQSPLNACLAHLRLKSDHWLSVASILHQWRLLSLHRLLKFRLIVTIQLSLLTKAVKVIVVAEHMTTRIEHTSSV